VVSTGPLGRLRAACGDGYVRTGGPADAVAGVPARWVTAPGSVEALSEVLGFADGEGLKVLPRGAATKLDWGTAPARVDLIVDTGRLAGPPEHASGDLVATVRAGTPMRALRAALATAGQRVSLDPASEPASATVGGVLATGEAGPLRLAHGTPRDLLIGVEFVRADGVVAHAGGKVVKNVAGYDLGKLLCGSFGTLGIVTAATLRLHPLPAARAWVLRPVRSPLEAHDLVGRLLASPLVPAAIEVDLPSVADEFGRAARSHPPELLAGAGTLGVLLEGSASGVAARAARAEELLGADVATCDGPPPWWGRYPFGPDDVALKIVAPVAELHAAVYALRDAAGRPVPVPVRGSAGAGVLYAALPGSLPPNRVAAVLYAIRATLLIRGGSCTVLSAPARIREEVDAWGAVPGVSLMRRVKEQFDPKRTLAPGRMVGGI
jgi:glycolate oxidase FAD binding subunit